MRESSKVFLNGFKSKWIFVTCMLSFVLGSGLGQIQAQTVATYSF